MLRAHPAAPVTAAQAARARAPNITFDYNGAAAAEPLARERIADALEDLVQLGADPPPTRQLASASRTRWRSWSHWSRRSWITSSTASGRSGSDLSCVLLVFSLLDLSNLGGKIKGKYTGFILGSGYKQSTFSPGLRECA